ncbi:MAG: PA2779 family protein [Alphaproteobacteria bacterium]
MGLRRFARAIAYPVVALLLLSSSVQPALARMIGTEEFLSRHHPADQRARVETLLAREDVKAELAKLGVDPQVAARRVASLSDDEIQEIARKIDADPAGQGAFGAVVFAALVVFLVLLFTDIVGETDAFDFDD